MSNLIMPKQSADPQEMYKVLEVYSEYGGWLNNRDLIEKLKLKINPNLEPQAYTKKTQIPAYFGFIEWHDKNNSQSPRRITESGYRFFNALKNENQTLIFEELLFSLETRTFGKNVTGVSSDSEIEPPQLFVKCVLELEFLTRREFGYILQQLDENKVNLKDLLEFVESNRILEQNFYKNIPPKFADVKPLSIMINWGFFVITGKENNNDRISINKHFINKYYNRLVSLKEFNNNISYNSTPYSDLLKQGYYNDIDDEQNEFETEEGKQFVVLHRKRERNRKIVLLKKKSVLKEKGKLICEVCSFDFAHIYGTHGEGFIECHHNTPISETKEGNKIKLSDLSILCSNCHRMIHHKKPWLTLDELRKLILNQNVRNNK